MEVHNFEIDGFTLKVRIEGKGPPAIVIGSHKYYPRTFSENLKQNFQFIFMDHRGFSKNDYSKIEADFDLEKILQDIDYLRRRLGLEKIIVFGHSIHALIALEYAKKNPDKVSHLILIASSPISGSGLYAEADRYFSESVCYQRKEILANNMLEFDIKILENPGKEFITRMLTFAPMIWHDPFYDARHLWEDVEFNLTGVKVIWGAMFNDYDINLGLKKIKCPIFLALGRYDYWNPPHLWEGERNKFNDLSIRIFEQSGHTPQLEESEAFDHELLFFLQSKK